MRNRFTETAEKSQRASRKANFMLRERDFNAKVAKRTKVAKKNNKKFILLLKERNY